MGKHTPGPWSVADDGLHAASIRRVIKGGGPKPRTVCIVEDWTTEADANLIAAAPDGLAAAELALEYLGAPNDPEHFDRVAEQFRRETGFARPGKDLAPADPQNLKERREAWAKWRRDKYETVHAALVAFVAKARGT